MKSDDDFASTVVMDCMVAGCASQMHVELNDVLMRRMEC